jgi:hypothetical protein
VQFEPQENEREETMIEGYIEEAEDEQVERSTNPMAFVEKLNYMDSYAR